MKWLALALVVVSSVALADGDRLDVEVGKTVERDGGYARGGWFCDDPSLITAELVTRDDHNVWIVTGVKVGSTQCRVGTEMHRPYVVFDVHVVPAKKPKADSRP